jgi:hypothetical protein
MSRVEQIWQTEIQNRGPDKSLFNGRLFSIERTQPGRIAGWLAEYKWFLAQRREPALYDALRVRPLAITGLLHCADGIVFGRRASHVEQDAGRWELVPSGGVDDSATRPDGSIDLAQHVIKELTEETGIVRELIEGSPPPFAIARDESSHVSDVGILLRTSLSEADIQATFARLTNREYTDLQVVAFDRVGEFIQRCFDSLAPVSLALLQSYQQSNASR